MTATLNDDTLSTEAKTALAHAVQEHVPLVENPFATLGEPLGLSEATVLAQVRQWRNEGKLREISAVLEGSTLGYESALVAGQIPASELERVAAIVNEHPTVTHNYERRHDYNLWFTIAVPLEMGLERTLAALAQLSGVPAFYPLRRTATFKIGVNFNLESRRSETEVKALASPAPIALDAKTLRLLRALQVPLPLRARPFAEVARGAGLDTAELLAFGNAHLGGAVRRYVGTFFHRQLGVRGNGMAVWRVPERLLAELGPRVASAPEVSHCYARETIPGFPYTLYSMLHGPDEQACQLVAERIAREIGVSDYLILFSTREFKKCRLRYLLPELEDWWRAHGTKGAPPR